MNAYERALAAVTNQPLDRIPSAEIFIDKGVRKALCGSEDYMDFCDFIDLEFAITNTPSSLYHKKVVDADKGIFVNEWGIKRQQGVEIVSSLLEPSLTTKELVMGYKAPDPYDDYRYEELKQLVKRFKGKRMIGFHVHDSFNYPYYLRGMENLFMDMYEDPEIVERLVDISVEHNIAMALRGIELGADFILLGDDYGASTSLLISPAQFREFFLPGFNKVVLAVKDAGAFCFKHCCGNINSILDDMVASGIDVLHPLDPSAGMDIVAVKEKYPNLTVMGGINCYEPLTSFSIEEIKEETLSVLEKVGNGGRHIIASSNSIHSKVKPENYLAMQHSRKAFTPKF